MKNSNEKEEINEQKRGSKNQSQTYEYNNTYDPEYNPLPLPSLSKNQINYSTLKDFIDQKDLKLNENTLKRIKVAQDGRIVLARKGNPHVSSACLNCRKSHLACDLNRPCNRCITSNKQDSCFDTLHKKRGRPRRRETTPVKSKRSTLSLAVEEAAMTSVYPNMITPFELNDYHDDYIKRYNNFYYDHHNSHPYLTARPILPKYSNHSVFSNPFDKMKPGFIDPIDENEELMLTLNNEDICINVEGTTLFCGFGSSQLLGANIMDRIHPNDRNKLRTKMSQITSRQDILLEIDPKTIIPDDTYPEVDIHFLGSTNEYHLITARLSHCNGSICLNIKKFDLDILLRKSHKGSPTLFL